MQIAPIDRHRCAATGRDWRQSRAEIEVRGQKRLSRAAKQSGHARRAIVPILTIGNYARRGVALKITKRVISKAFAVENDFSSGCKTRLLHSRNVTGRRHANRCEHGLYLLEQLFWDLSRRHLFSGYPHAFACQSGRKPTNSAAWRSSIAFHSATCSNMTLRPAFGGLESSVTLSTIR
jgi:hypothetical protein